MQCNSKLSFTDGTTGETGFTLVELLVVIAIIAILTAIAVPAFLDQRKKSYDTSLRSDVKNAATVAQTALTEYGSWKELAKSAGLGSTTTTIYSNPNSGVRVPTSTIAKYWNDIETLPPLMQDKGTYIEFVHIPNDIPATHWVKHNDTEFCLFASHANGKNYHWNQDSINALGDAAYDQVLFYDVRLGGLVDMKEIASVVAGKTDKDAASLSSCHGYGLRYLNVTGGNGP